MTDMVESHKNVTTELSKNDLFNNLLTANSECSDGSKQLTNDELLGMCCYVLCLNKSWSRITTPGNIFTFLLAGHEV